MVFPEDFLDLALELSLVSKAIDVACRHHQVPLFLTSGNLHFHFFFVRDREIDIDELV